MRFSVLIIAFWLVGCDEVQLLPYELEYDVWFGLDAEYLAEGGVKDAYDRLLSSMPEYLPSPAQVEEIIDAQAPSYSVRSGTTTYEIYAPHLSDEEGQSWGRATFAFFDIVNSQLGSSDHRLYALGGGNELGGVFVTEEQAEEARGKLARRSDWPYIPTSEHPYYGQFR